MGFVDNNDSIILKDAASLGNHVFFLNFDHEHNTWNCLYDCSKTRYMSHDTISEPILSVELFIQVMRNAKGNFFRDIGCSCPTTQDILINHASKNHEI